MDCEVEKFEQILRNLEESELPPLVLSTLQVSLPKLLSKERAFQHSYNAPVVAVLSLVSYLHQVFELDKDYWPFGLNNLVVIALTAV